jgi:hypothetical protein
MDALKTLTHAMKHLVNYQPSRLEDCTPADDDAMDIISCCKELIRAEQVLEQYRKGEHVCT